jgi:hypothetical protein
MTQAQMYFSFGITHMGYKRKPKARFRQSKIQIGPRVIKRPDGEHVVSDAVDRLAKRTGKSLIQLENEGKIVQLRSEPGKQIWKYEIVTLRKGRQYDRVLVGGLTYASRNNLTGNMSGNTAFFKFFKLMDGKSL